MVPDWDKKTQGFVRGGRTLLISLALIALKSQDVAAGAVDDKVTMLTLQADLRPGVRAK